LTALSARLLGVLGAFVQVLHHLEVVGAVAMSELTQHSSIREVTGWRTLDNWSDEEALGSPPFSAIARL
jgi:hypothetical protein